jgi:dipeptidyl aminopeptidase/acylaminoacyl peptidase
LVDLDTGRRRPLTSSAPAGLQDHLVTPAKLVYESFGGRAISAYHYPPAAAQHSERHPLLVIVHGGPTSQFSDTFNLQAQFFAASGYHVLLPNVRGSSGYGREFEDLNNGDWGHGDLRDVLAGVAHLRRRSDVDPDRTAIMGTSYGGILSMAATVWAAPGVFRATVPCSGYCDFVYTVGDEELRNSKQLYYEFGKLPEARAVYERCSPLYWAHQAATPCFIIQGEGLYPGSHSSKDFALALEAAYKPFWFKAYQGETYYVSSRANVRRMLLDTRMFLDFYVRGVPHAPLNVGDAPLNRLNGVIPYRSWLANLPFVPPSDGPRYGIGT